MNANDVDATFAGYCGTAFGASLYRITGAGFVRYVPVAPEQGYGTAAGTAAVSAVDSCSDRHTHTSWTDYYVMSELYNGTQTCVAAPTW